MYTVHRNKTKNLPQINIYLGLIVLLKFGESCFLQLPLNHTDNGWQHGNEDNR